MARMKGDMASVGGYVLREKYGRMKRLKKVRFPSANKHWVSPMINEALDEYIEKHWGEVVDGEKAVK